MDRLKEFKLPQDDVMEQITGEKDSAPIFGPQGHKKLMTGVDFRNTCLHYDRGISINKQFERTKAKSSHLPCHMQHYNGRLGQS